MHANFKSLKARSMGNFGEVFDLVNSVQIAKLNTCQLNLMHILCAYGGKASDRQIKF